MEIEEAEKLCEEFAARIGEHFDHVQIFVSWNEGARSFCTKRGVGNWWSRQGMAHEFINEDINQDNAKQISEYMKASAPPSDEEGDNEEWKSKK